MSFLDNLENNLKALESRDEKDPEKIKRDQERREAETAAARQRAPYVDALKNSPFTFQLLTQCRTIGHAQRVLVKFTWIGEALRLDAKEKRLELIPTADGIAAVFCSEGKELRRSKVDLDKDNPEAFARNWLAGS